MDSAMHMEPIRAPDDTGGNLIGSGLKCQREIGTVLACKHLEPNDLRGVTCAPPRVQIQRHKHSRSASVSTRDAESQQRHAATRSYSRLRTAITSSVRFARAAR
jgi:hypothetical protein